MIERKSLNKQTGDTGEFKKSSLFLIESIRKYRKEFNQISIDLVTAKNNLLTINERIVKQNKILTDLTEKNKEIEDNQNKTQEYLTKRTETLNEKEKQLDKDYLNKVSQLDNIINKIDLQQKDVNSQKEVLLKTEELLNKQKEDLENQQTDLTHREDLLNEGWKNLNDTKVTLDKERSEIDKAMAETEKIKAEAIEIKQQVQGELLLAKKEKEKAEKIVNDLNIKVINIKKIETSLDLQQKTLDLKYHANKTKEKELNNLKIRLKDRIATNKSHSGL